MQRVSGFLPWDKRNSGARSKSSGSGLSWWTNNNNNNNNRSSTSSSINSAANGPNGLASINTVAANTDNGRVRREAFWPATLELECDKAARILKSFCCDGYLAPTDDEDKDSFTEPNTEPQTPVKVTKKIPRRIIQNAAGIAIFTCMRSGLWMTGSGGSGILIARKSDGTWSPPSGIMLHTPTLSFIIGVDVYDCVLVINNLAALESMTRPRLTLGEDVGLTGGPLVSLDSNESEIRWKDLGNTVLTYMKARGQHQVVNLNGCILTERANENERFYSSNVTQMDILSGNIGRHVDETKVLFDVIKMAEGRTDFDKALIDRIATDPAPGDAVIATPKSTPASPRNAFGIPSALDPDPFGVLALEMAGLEIREAGSRLRPASSQLEFNPAPSSPALSKFNRQSVETFTTKSNRGSYMSTHTTKSRMSDAGTQTDVGKTPETTPSPGQSEDGVERTSFEQIPEAKEDDDDVDYTTVDTTPIKHLSQRQSLVEVPEADASTTERDLTMLAPTPNTDDIDKASKASSNYDKDDSDDEDGHVTNDTNDADDEEDEDEEEEEEPVIFEVTQVQPARTQAVASRMIQAKGSMVTIPKRLPPPLPKRSPARHSRASKSEIGDVTSLKSPLRQEFDDAGAKSDDTEGLTPVQIVIDDVQPDEVKAEANAKDLKTEVMAEDTKAEDIKAEDAKTKEAEMDETKADEAKGEESKPEDVKLEDTKDEDTKDEDTKVEAIDEIETKHDEAKEAAEIVDSKVESAKAADTEAEDLAAADYDITPTRIEEPKTEEPSFEAAKTEEQKTDELETEQGKTEEPKTNELKPQATKADDSEPEASQIKKDTPGEPEVEDTKDDAASIKTPRSEQSDNSDSTFNKKHTSSIFTGATEDRWSLDGSSLTTPTSERPFSALDDAARDETPTKEKETSDMKDAEVYKADERETTPTPITAG